MSRQRSISKNGAVARLARPTIGHSHNPGRQKQVCRRRMAAQDRQGLGKHAAHSIIEGQRHAGLRLRPQQSIEIEEGNAGALQRQEEPVEGLRRIGQNRSGVIDAMERQDCAHDAVTEVPWQL